MPAPKDTQWSNVISNNKGSAKLGIKVWTEDLGTKVKEHMEVWYWSQYSVYDESNEFFISVWGEEFWSIGSILINHTSNTSWSESNQTLIGSWTGTHTKYENARNGNASVKFTGIEYGGGSGSFVVTFNVSALTTYTISYNANGGSNAPSSQTKWYGSALTLTSSVPTRTGYTFLGWGTSASDTTVDYKPSSTYGTNANITLYAIWKPHEYQVYFDANGGSNAPSGLTKLHDVALPLPSAIPIRTNHTFLGWNTYASATDVLYTAGSSYTTNASATLYAVWHLDYVKPRIDNMTVARCDANGNERDDGTYVKVKFDWETDRDNVMYAVYYKKKSDNAYTIAQKEVLYDTSGSVSALIYDSSGNSVVFDTEYPYVIKVNVADNNGYNSHEKPLNALFIPIDATPQSKNISFGEPAKDDEDGVLRFAYKTVDVAPKSQLLYKGSRFFGQTLLWSGNSLMTEASTITLPKTVGEMKNGILLVFSRDGDYNVTSYFVPKDTIASFGRTGWNFPLCTVLFDYIGAKTLYISTDKIEGHKDNDATGKNETSGITYHNEAFRLRYVYEV